MKISYDMALESKDICSLVLKSFAEIDMFLVTFCLIIESFSLAT